MAAQINIRPESCTPRFRDLLVTVVDCAEYMRYEFITPEFLLYQIVTQSEFKTFAEENSIKVQFLESELLNYVHMQDKVPDDEEYDAMFSSELEHLFHLVEEDFRCRMDMAIADQVPAIDVPDILRLIYKLDPDCVARHLLVKYLGEDYMPWDNALQKAYERPKSREAAFQRMMISANRLMGTLNALQSRIGQEVDSDESAEMNRESEPWEQLVTCLNDTCWSRNPLIGRQKELDRCIRILCRKDKNNPLFIGEPGVGKTALIYGLARMIENCQVPEWLDGKEIYALDMASIVAGSSYHGEFEKRMKMVLEGLRERGGCILYIDEIHTLCETGGGSQSMNAAEILKPYLEDGSIRFIGTTTYQDYNKSMANKKAFVRRFGQIDVKEPSVEETIEILNGLLPSYEAHHGVRYADAAIRYAVEQADALIHDRFLPDKAIDLIDEAGAYLQQHPLLNKNGNPKQARFQKVDIALVKRILTDVCRIDAKSLTSENNQELKDLDQRIASEIYGQDAAIRQVVRSVMMSKAGLIEPDKPIASLLFVGPTGVGKTEVCKVLARELGIELVRFDMSEYTEKHTVSKLIGSPAGYVGYDEGGLLTDAIRKTPNCVLLLDEIEKAHTDIYNILLQVMDYARLTDNKGNRADFRNVILVMTSNAGAQFASQAGIGFSGGQTKGQAMLSSVRKTFKPEFLNRLSATVVFNDMDRTMATLILDKKLRQLSQRLEARKASMTLTPSAYNFLLEKGFNPQYGAREMDRAIQQHLTPLLMEQLLFGKLRKGGTITVDIDHTTQSLTTTQPPQ